MRNSRIALILATGVIALTLAACSRERGDWTSAQQADTAEGYQQFLQQHPNSNNAPQAQARIKQLAEDRDWQAASAADTRDAYEQFVAQHADSKWAQEARIRIENFAQSSAPGAAGAAGAASATTVAGSNAATAAAAPAPGVGGATPLPVAPPSPAAASAAAPEKPAPSVAKHASKPVASSTAAAAASTGRHYVQLGAFSSKARAESEWKLLVAKFPAQLQALKPRYVAGKSRSKQVYRLQVSAISRDGARALCSSLKKRSQACVPVSG